jgi:hypothetical protein
MSMDYRELIGCVSLLLGGFTLFQFESVTARKLGLGLVWLASGLGVHAISGSLLLACAMLTAWVLFPLWEMVFVLRQLRVPRQRVLADARAPRDEFEELSSLTGDMIEAGFEQLDECRLRPAEHEQYYRIFIRKDGLVQATIGYIAQGPIGFHFVAFTSQTKDGRRWVTWDYPLTYGLVMPPETAVYRALQCTGVSDLYQSHLDFLTANDLPENLLLAVEPTRDAARARMEENLNQQIEYNISRGYLAPATKRDNENFCYSWRGTLYVAGQVLRDLLF